MILGMDIEVKISKTENDAINARIADFVNKVSSAEYYSRVRRGNPKYIADQIRLGKKSEWLATKGLHEHFGYPLIDVDFDIRRNRAKGWYIDLPYKKFNPDCSDVAVKGCSKWSADRYGLSWMFQYADRYGGCDDIFHNDDNCQICGMYMENAEDAVGFMKALIPWKLAKLFLKNPKEEKHKGRVQCLYYDDLVSGKCIL